MSIHKQSGQNNQEINVLYLKGAPDVLLSKCSHYLSDNGEKKLIDDDFMKTYVLRYEAFGGNVSVTFTSTYESRVNVSLDLLIKSFLIY